MLGLLRVVGGAVMLVWGWWGWGDDDEWMIILCACRGAVMANDLPSAALTPTLSVSHQCVPSLHQGAHPACLPVCPQVRHASGTDLSGEGEAEDGVGGRGSFIQHHSACHTPVICICTCASPSASAHHQPHHNKATPPTQPFPTPPHPFTCHLNSPYCTPPHLLPLTSPPIPPPHTCHLNSSPIPLPRPAPPPPLCSVCV